MHTRISRVIMLTMVIFQFSACSTTPRQTQPQAMNSSDRVPGASATVKASKGENDNTQIDLRVAHLALPSKMESEANTYVVWTRRLDTARNPSSEHVQSLGTLHVDENLNGTLSAVTPLNNFELFITAEPSGLVSHPTGDRLLWTQINR